MDHKHEIDPVTGTETTGHSWDGIKELNTPLPRWWLWTFYACIAYAVAYMIAYPAIPLLHSNTKGLLDWSSRGQLLVQVADADTVAKPFMEKIAASDLATIQADPQLLQYAVSAGESLFKVNCVQCHGSGAEGGIGYPNLNDDSWIWGGTVEDIHTTIAHGVRYAADPNTRISDMTAFGRDGLLTKEQIADVAHHVVKMSGQEADTAAADRGTTVFADNCAACHGEKGEGNKELGAPQLNDNIWLYGGTLQDVMTQVHTPRQGEMPAWQGRLGDVAVKELALYVASLGGAEKAAVAGADQPAAGGAEKSTP